MFVPSWAEALSEAETEKLTDDFDRVVLMLDGDGPGREASRKITGQLEGRVGVQVINLPDGKQPDQLSSEDIRGLLETKVARPGNRQNLAAIDTRTCTRPLMNLIWRCDK